MQFGLRRLRRRLFVNVKLMPENQISKPKIGIGFREQFRADIFLHRSQIDFLEITTDHYLDAKPNKLDELKMLKEHFPLVPHSLELSLGSAEGVDEEYLEKIAEIVEFVEPEWFSDHLCFTKSGGVKIGHLAPVPYTEESLKVFIKNISKVKKRISTPFIVENITYLMEFPSSKMSETQFITKVVNETDCGLLLDITNLYINSRNFGFDWRKFLDEIPIERVVQLHFVGIHKHKNILIDAHAHRTQSEIWQVFSEVSSRCEIKGAVLERDENFPPFTEILDELDEARRLLETKSMAKKN